MATLTIVTSTTPSTEISGLVVHSVQTSSNALFSATADIELPTKLNSVTLTATI